jgi:hypothetical protein
MYAMSPNVVNGRPSGRTSLMAPKANTSATLIAARESLDTLRQRGA